jgi:hypothetical protein
MAQQGEEFFGRLDGSTGGGGVEQDRKRRGLDGLTGRGGEEGGWTDQWLDRGKRG